jgi:hypothetical protein
MVAVFNDRTHAAALADLRDIINTIDRSLAPEQVRMRHSCCTMTRPAGKVGSFCLSCQAPQTSVVARTFD